MRATTLNPNMESNNSNATYIITLIQFSLLKVETNHAFHGAFKFVKTWGGKQGFNMVKFYVRM